MIRQHLPLAIKEIGPEHHGLTISDDEFARLPWRAGYHYELVGGVLEVAPLAGPEHNDIADAIVAALRRAKNVAGTRHFRRVTTKCRIIASDAATSTTNAEPDAAAYVDYSPQDPRSYEGLNPGLVVEVVSPDSTEKDYVRNLQIYSAVPSILEYWVIDPTRSLDAPAMTAFHRESGDRPFARVEVASGGVYDSPTWQGLRLDLNRLSWEDAE